jgi:eukaryotic-like serine/threonine-protein kinase
VVGGKYRLVRRLARGGMGSVWLAKHQSLDSEVAVKLMSPSLTETPTALSRFEREAKASAQLRSPHIVRVQDYGIEDESPFMVLELLHGEDLGQRLERRGRLPMDEVVQINTQVCKALTVAHDAGIVHRDLKPSNVFLAREGSDEVVKLFDFGIARETRSQLVDERTSSGVVLGSPHHMSPEQAQGMSVDHRSDLWSLGVVLFRALTGKRPFEGDNMTAVMISVVTHPIPMATEVCPDLPAPLDRFFARALSRDVERRFTSAAAMSEALAAIARGESADTWLSAGATAPSGRGRDEPTLDAAAPISGQEKAMSDATASRELRAVTAGLVSIPGSRPRTSRVLRALPWAALVVGIGAVGFVAGQTRLGASATQSNGAPAKDEAIAPAADPAAPADTALPQTREPPSSATSNVVVAPAVEPSSAPAGSPQASQVLEGAPPPAQLPPTQLSPTQLPPKQTPPTQAPKVAPSPPKPSPKIDPFTGLPISP